MKQHSYASFVQDNMGCRLAWREDEVREFRRGKEQAIMGQRQEIGRRT